MGITNNSILELAHLPIEEFKEKVKNLDTPKLDELMYYLNHHDKLQHYRSKTLYINNVKENIKAMKNKPIFAQTLYSSFYINPEEITTKKIKIDGTKDAPTLDYFKLRSDSFKDYYGASISGSKDSINKFKLLVENSNPNWNGLDNKGLFDRVLKTASECGLAIHFKKEPQEVDAFVRILAEELRKISPSKKVYPIGINPALHPLWSSILKQNRSVIFKDDNTDMQWGRALLLFSRAAKKLGLPPFGKTFSDNISKDAEAIKNKIISGNKEGCKLANAIFTALSSVNLTSRVLTQESLHNVGTLNSLYYITTQLRFGLNKSTLAHDVFQYLAKNFGFITKKVGDHYSTTKKLGFTTDVSLQPTESGKTMQVFITSWVTKEDACRLVGKDCSSEKLIGLLKKMGNNWFRKNRLVL